ncbi:MAG: hypothetical protein AAGA42_12295 [Actinomycetota bacterium]
MRASPRPAARRSLARLAVGTLAVAACAGGDGDAEPSPSESTAAESTADEPTDDDPTSPVVIVDEPGDDDNSVDIPGSSTTDATGSTPTTAPAATTTLATVPDTGVPGLDSELPFCQAWSTFAGSFQALALASAFATDPDAARGAEVAASPVLIAAAVAIDAQLPEALEAERGVLTVDALGPLLRRAERNVAALRTAGATDAELDAIGEAWFDALASAGIDDPDIAPVLAEATATLVADAAAVVASETPPINQDPSLVTNAAIPETEAYLVANCPDQGTLAGNDIVDG